MKKIICFLMVFCLICCCFSQTKNTQDVNLNQKVFQSKTHELQCANELDHCDCFFAVILGKNFSKKIEFYFSISSHYQGMIVSADKWKVYMKNKNCEDSIRCKREPWINYEKVNINRGGCKPTEYCDKIRFSITTIDDVIKYDYFIIPASKNYVVVKLSRTDKDELKQMFKSTIDESDFVTQCNDPFEFLEYTNNGR